MSSVSRAEAGARPAEGNASSADPCLSLVFHKHVKKKLRSYEVPLPSAPLADTHAHLTCFWGKDPAEALARAALAGDRLLVTLRDPVCEPLSPAEFGQSLRAWIARARELLAASSAHAAVRAEFEPPFEHLNDPEMLFEHVRFLVGVHPYGAPEYSDTAHAELRAALEDPLCAGVGEIGLDYHFDAADDVAPAPHGVQIACFERQLALAVEHNLPVELHLRNEPGDAARAAHADAYRVLQSVGLPQAGCILHCFTEDRATMERFVELGCHIAFGGAATFRRNEPIREAFAVCPSERVLFETDCPYMAPEPLRGSECEPAMIAFTADVLCRDRAARTGEEPAAIAHAAYENACRIFAGSTG